MSGMSTIQEFLRHAEIPYSVIPHAAAPTAQQEAAAAHIPGRDWAKVVVCVVDGEPVEAVVPATCVVSPEKLLELTGGRALRVADEDELPSLFPGCEPGAMSPLGPVYAQRVFVDVLLAAQPFIAFSAGTHANAILMRWADFSRVVRPFVGRFAESRRDGVPACRLSWRE